MAHDTLLKPPEFMSAGLHPDQMIVFPTRPSISRRYETASSPSGWPERILAMSAFAAGFIVGQYALLFIQ